ncbi:MAG: cobyrinate a,c-diamide synthase [Proteobacteria bacterium]|nr:cobyrinate a,c-diamide synthase [Pseudomonadota bacterium]
MNGLIIAAPSSGSGKTVITLALLRALRRRGISASSFKVGPDYIDPQFHTLSSGRQCANIDLWAMRPGTVSHLLSGGDDSLTVIEGVMGLFDGAQNGEGSTADVAVRTGYPVVLVVDVKGQSQSAAAVVKGFAAYRDGVDIAAVIFNRVGSPRHRAMIERAMVSLEIPVAGYIPRNEDFTFPERHLGLVQAQEHDGIEALLEGAATIIDAHIDLALLQKLARPLASRSAAEGDAPLTPLPPLGQKIAIAKDGAFSFLYPHLVEGWRRAGAEISFFSPLNDEPPRGDADAVFLPGGYPENYAGELSVKSTFFDGLGRAKEAGSVIYGECGGFMVLGRSLIDREGAAHPMAGLLPVSTSFAAPKLSLGYRSVTTNDVTPFGPAGTVLRGHEFHYTQECDGAIEHHLFSVQDAVGTAFPACGAKIGTVMGSYIHLIDRA